ncbi:MULTISPECIES: sigma-w pathway protein ysdB [Bacillales]|uniref:Sigma-w pathway protein ysdB n=1 Tax=Lysinibacillus louembei TaxID=1470088 RepID=A0ABZ0RUE4_9BACI|nr:MULTISPECIES: sigma-w pathway protein ysdB [Bacillales]MCT6924560.1 sigma-w pathway protein ysdB [Metasolibacillus sp.]MCT6940726.1 sigma-w pathway protein ysdB [Metasolibacillus sp.]WPK10684.1 sigma-w pathway protein ysdB [Lysinibacillus louembei]
MALLLRVLILVVVIYIFYKGVRYLIDPKRKLDEAYENGQYYFYDDVKNVRKNFFISYKGALFEGEKYLGATEDAFEVISIFVFVHDTMKLQGLTKSDFLYLEKEIKMSYPNAKISWKNPIEQLMKEESSEHL